MSSIHATLLDAVHLQRCFSENYAQAHARFIEQASHHPLTQDVRELLHDVSGPEGEALLTSAAWLGNPDAERVLVLQSGTHGVEGFVGSAIQLDTLVHFEQHPLPDNVALCCIHALNPYGFAWLRRVDQQGIDLNRNFIDFSRPLPENEGYRQLADALLPATDAERDECDRQLAQYRQQHGPSAYEQAVSGGQYEFADGLFYGGQAPSQSRIYLEKLIADYRLAERQCVAVIDIHSGLGPFGYGEVICDHPPGSRGVQLARQWYGESVTEPALGSSSSVPKQGLVDYHWQAQLGERVCFVTLEFGTYSIDEMFDALRRDHRLHRKPVDWQSDETRTVKRQLRRIFYPATADWQEMVLMRGRQLIRQALKGLSAT